MGVKDLWPVLEPYSERKPLFELQGKVVAIDLAGWVCESLCVVDYSVQPRFYLRNLFFRTCYLLLSGVTPVYVLEGSAPALKYGVICKRQETQFIGARPKNTQDGSANKGPTKPKSANSARNAFNHVLKQCEELVLSMGLTCIQGPGEAEAFCAYLNQYKLVDGVISQDSDCFAYGATRVYRNFSVSSQGKTAAQGGAVDVYELSRLPKEMDFGQFKMIAMALLCGCDYCPDGVGGVGREATMRLFTLYSNNEILPRLKSWRDNMNHYTDLELRVDDKGICTNCGHRGKMMVHTKAGCDECRQPFGCNEALWREKRLSIKAELSIRRKAMDLPDFPSQAVIDEFLNRPIELPRLDLNWKQPNVVKFLRCMTKMLQWEEIYCFQKFLPILTRWQLNHFGNPEKRRHVTVFLGSVQPYYIKKKRSPKGVASYEIVWKDELKCFEGLIPECQLKKFNEENANNPQLLWSTIEPVDLVQNAFPAVVEQFFAAALAKKKSKSRKRDAPPKKTENVDIPKKKKKKTIEPKTPVLIDRFLNRIKNPRPKSISPIPAPSVSPKVRTSSKQMGLPQFSFSSDGDWSMIDDSHDLSTIINEMVGRATEHDHISGQQLRYEPTVVPCFQPKTSHDVSVSVSEEDFETINQFQKHEQESPLSPEKLSNHLPDESGVLDEFDLMVQGSKYPVRNEFDHSSTPKSRKSLPHDGRNIYSDRSSTPTNGDQFSFKDSESYTKSSPAITTSDIYSNRSSTPTIDDKFSFKDSESSPPATIASPPQSPICSANSTSAVLVPSPNILDSTAKDHRAKKSEKTDDLNVSHFFTSHLDDDVDEFEKSIDFMNMPDQKPPKVKTKKSSRRSIVMRTSTAKVSDDSFNLSSYVPISAQLRNKIIN